MTGPHVRARLVSGVAPLLARLGLLLVLTQRPNAMASVEEAVAEMSIDVTSTNVTSETPRDTTS